MHNRSAAVVSPRQNRSLLEIARDSVDVRPAAEKLIDLIVRAIARQMREQAEADGRAPAPPNVHQHEGSGGDAVPTIVNNATDSRR